jgi:hypothetical protein
METACCTNYHECLASYIPERPRYYPRQLVTPGDLTLEADYFRAKLRRHNRLLHGWGVVCGAIVCRAPGKPGEGPLPGKVAVGPGYILGPYGDEIVIHELQLVDLHAAPGSPNGSAMDDPWCASVQKPQRGGKACVAVKYKETQARPVRVAPAGCGCEDTPCQYSRWRDGFEFGVLEHCPPSHTAEPPTFNSLLHLTRLPACPPCPEDPWVVLACIDMDENGEIKNVNNYECRRVVLSFAEFWQRVALPTRALTPSSSVIKDSAGVVVTELETGKVYQLTIGFADDLKEDVTPDLGAGVTISDVKVAGKTLAFTATVAADVNSAQRTLTLTFGDCTQAIVKDYVVKIKGTT